MRTPLRSSALWPEMRAAVAIDKHLAQPFEAGDEWVSVPTDYVPSL